jgi:hypothetical protein
VPVISTGGIEKALAGNIVHSPFFDHFKCLLKNAVNLSLLLIIAKKIRPHEIDTPDPNGAD